MGGKALRAVAALLGGRVSLRLRPDATELRLEVVAPRAVEAQVSEALLVFFIDDEPAMRRLYEGWIAHPSPLHADSRCGTDSPPPSLPLPPVETALLPPSSSTGGSSPPPTPPLHRVFPPDNLDARAADEAMRDFPATVLSARPRPRAVMLDQNLRSQVCP